jgi:hypothetical protein
MDSTAATPGCDLPPRGGDVSLCIMCGNLMIFNADLTIRKPTKEEQSELALNPLIIEAQIAAAYITGNETDKQK